MLVPIFGRSFDEIGVPLRAVHQLADDEQRPALADEAERAGDRTVLVVALLTAGSIAVASEFA